jgi:membrane protease YdiL (CAAX protease family)
METRDASLKAAAGRDIALVMAAIVAAWLITKYVLYPALGVPDNAPMILRPITGFAVAWILLRRGGERWSAYGLARPANLLRCIGVAVALYAVIWLESSYVVPMLAQILTVHSAPPFLAYIRGHPLALAGWLGISWIVGAFFEELLFRAYLLSRIERLVGGGSLGTLAGIAGQAALFGLLHAYQGSFGLVSAATFAFIFGLAYVATGRNLWPLVLVHGVWNTTGIVMMYTR